MARKKLPEEVKTRIKDLKNVLSDSRPKCNLEKLAIERQLADLSDGHKRELIWNEDEAQRACQFFTKLVHGVGSGWKWSNKPFELMPYQEQCIIAPLFGWYKEDKRRFQIGGVEIPRKNGKSTLSAGIALQGLIADKELAAEVYSAATAQEQSAVCFNYAQKMLGPELKPIVRDMKHSMEFDPLRSIFKPVSSEYKILDGKNVHRCIIDELHQHSTRAVWDILVNATGARLNSLIFWISYAGFDRQSIWWEQHEYGRKLLEKTLEDDSYFFYATGIDEGDDWTDPKVWKKANPQLEISIDPSKFAAKALRAQQSPAEENDFKRVHLNCATEQDVRFIPMHLWDDQCEINPDDKESIRRWESELIGQSCYAGLDLASTRDLTAWVLLFPLDGKLKILAKHFAPEEADNERAKYDLQSYKYFSDRGYITLTPGNATDYTIVKKQIWEDAKKYNIRMMAFDPHQSMMLYQELVNEGWPYPEETLKSFHQGAANFNEPMVRLIELLKERKLDHKNDPLLRWQASNVIARQNNSGYLKPDKVSGLDKFDGITAMLMALGLFITYGQPYAIGSFYENNDIEIF